MPNYSITRPFVIVSDLREIEDIVLRRNGIIDRAPIMHDFFSLLFPRATVSMRTTQEFKQKRGMWNSILMPKFMHEVLGPCVYDAVQDLIELWKQKKGLAGDLPFHVGEDLRQMSLEVIWKTLLNEKFGVLR